MTPYWLLFALWTTGAVQSERRPASNWRLWLFVAASIMTTVMIGLRFEVGADWINYLGIYDNIVFLSLRDAVVFTDVGYGLLNWTSAQFDLGIAPVNLICGTIFFSGFAYLCWRQPNPALAVLVGVPYLIIVVAMGYTRQAAAIGLLCFAVADASEKRLVKTVVLIGCAALFHKTAILMLPIVLTPIFLRNYLLGALGIGLFILLFMLTLRGSTNDLVDQYVTSTYDSQGAAVRIAMNVVAAAIFLLVRKSIDLPYFQKIYWTLTAMLALVSVLALFVASASSGIDRFSLYLIPLQTVVYSRLPYAFSKTGKAVPSVLLAVILYSFTVQFVWINYADNASYWLPYKIGF